jgi:uncharacterized repeat protein (TIGR02543 family)
MKKRTLSILLALCLLLSLVPALGGTAKASGAQDAQFNKILNPTAPSGYDANSTEDPYMKGKDHPFLLSEQDEALFYMQYNSGVTRGSATQWVDDTFKKGDVDDKSAKCSGQPLTTTTENYVSTHMLNSSSPVTKEGLGTGMAYVTAVSFDPTGSGRKDHVAYVGYNVDSKKIETWVMDAKTGSYSTPVALTGEITDSWIQLTQYNYRAFFSITAGDYDGDHKDTYVVYCPGTNTVDPQLYEYALVGSSYQQRSKTSVLSENMMLNAALNGKTASNDTYGGNGDYPRMVNMQTMSLATGDFDGDGVDELAAAVGTYIVADKEKVNLFAATRVSELDQDKNSKAFSRTSYSDLQNNLTNENDVQTFRMLYAGQIAAGDVNNDGQDEIVAAGYTGVATCKNGTDWSGTYDRDKSNYAVSTVFCQNGAYVRTELALVQMNGFTSGHTEHIGATHYTWPVASIACAAINGDSSADEVFLSGTLYTWEDGVLTKAFQPDYFGKKFDTIDEMTDVWDHWVDSVAVGNFDGNDAGRQQIMFTVCAINKDSKYIYKAGIIGGNKYKDTTSYDADTGKTTVTSYGQAEKYYSSDIQNDTYNLCGKDQKHNSWWDDTTADPCEILNCVPVAIDCDQDGVMAKYAGKGYVYTDPSILAVLQAAPYFGELGSYSSFGGTTSYSVTTSYTYGKTSSNNVSFGFGFAGDFEFPAVQVSVEAGYTLNWSKSFEHSLTTSYSSTFTAGPYDQVILQRTPALVYSYSVMKKDRSYADNAYQFTVPLKPVYTKLSVDEYNQFVDYYDAWYKTNITDSADAVQKDPSVLLKKMSTELLPDNNEGNPSAYRSDWSKHSVGSGTDAVSDNAMSLSKGEYALNHSGGSTTSEWSVESSDTESITFEHGFHFSLTVQTGPKLLLSGFGLGAYANLDYSHGSGHYNTTTKAEGATGTVGDIDGPALAEKGIPLSVSSAYGFTWSFGKWEGDLGGVCLNSGVRDANKNPLFDGNVPFFGYAVNSITAPPAPVTTLTAKLATDSSAALSWTAPSGQGTGCTYNVYRVENGTYTQINSAPLTDTTYTAALDKSNTDYFFVVTTVKDNEESAWSNVATVTTPKQYYTLTITGQVTASAGYSGVSVTNGGKCPEDTIVYISAKALDGYALTGYQIGSGTAVTFDPCETKDLNFNFPAQNTTVAFTTQPVSSNVSVQPNDNSMGSVTATVGGTSMDGEGTVTDVVVVHAEPKEGNSLLGWLVTEKDSSGNTISTTTISDDGSHTLKLNPVKPGYSITANFAPAETVQKTVTVNVPLSGSIEVKDSGGSVLTPNASNQIKVVQNSILTFRAVPDSHYTFKNWTGGALTGNTNPQSFTVAADITVGAVFSAPVLYKLTIGQPAAGGSISAASGVTTGANLPAGSSVVLQLTKDTGYALDHWLVNGTPTPGGDTLTLTLSKNTTVSAVLVQGFQITASAGEGGSISPAGASAVTSGDSLTCRISPDNGYEIADVTVDGSSVGTPASYTFSSVTADHTIRASFRQITTPGGGGTGGSGTTGTDRYTLSFETNGGRAIGSVTADSGTVIDLTDYIPVRTGFDFDGWYSNTSLTRPVSSVKLTQDTTVYASWTKVRTPEMPFTDVPGGAYYRDAVSWAYGEGIVTGLGASVFGPDGVCTRAQAVTFLWRAAGSPAARNAAMPFADVPYGSYYYDAVAWAVSKGIAKGTSRTTFSPNASCTRAQIVSFLWRANGSPAISGANPFRDVNRNAYYLDAVLWASANGITDGTGAGMFSPDNVCTRAQIVTFLWRSMNG